MRPSLRTVAAALAAAGLAACAAPAVRAPLAAGVTAARADDWDAAVRHWTEAVRADPLSAAAHNNLAVAYEKRGAWEEARREYETAVRLAPDDPAIRLNFASFLARLEAFRGGKT